MRLEPPLRRSRLLVLRGLGSDLRWAAGLMLAVLVTTVAAAVFPPLYQDARDSALEEEVASATSRERDLEVVQASRLPAESLSGSGARRLRAIPPALARLIDTHTLVVDTPVYGASSAGGSPDPPGTIRLLTLRSHAGFAEHVRFLDGRAPQLGHDAAEPLPIALSEATAAAFSVDVGDRLLLEPAFDQPQLASVPLVEQRPTTIEITGIFTARRSDPYWFGDLRSLRPQVEDTESARIVRASGVLPLTAYPALLAKTGGMPLTYRWRYHVAGERLQVAALERLEAAARSLELRYGVVAERGSAAPETRTGIGRIFDRFREQQRVASASLSFTAAGFAALALIVVAAVSLAGGSALRRALRLAGDRGGPTLQAAAAIALVLVLPAVLAGLALSAASEGPRTLGVALSLAFAAAAGITILAVVSPRGRVPHDPVAAQRLRQRRARRRAAIEATLITVAVACVVALRTRTESPESFDLLAAATPILVTLAVAAFALRLGPPLARLVGARLRRRDDLAPTLALRRVERQGVLGAPALVVPLVAVAVTMFASLTKGGTTDAGAPLLQTVGEALTTISFLSVAYATAAIGVVVAVIVREQAEAVTLLADLGLLRRQRLTLGLAQFVPTILVGVLLGLAAAVLAFAAVRPAFAAADSFALGTPLAAALAFVALPLAGAIAAAVSIARWGPA